MSWTIKCTDEKCLKEIWVANIVDLINDHRDSNGWFTCDCGAKGYIEKSFELQEKGEVWEPYLRGIISLETNDNTYQPFVFLVSYDPIGKPDSIWFSYYKDLREQNGRLKLGYGPGGPPVLNKSLFIKLIGHLIDLNILTKEEILKLIS